MADDSPTETLQKLLASVDISSFPLPSESRVCSIEETTNVADAIQFLNSKNFLAAPVRRAGVADGAPWSEAFAGTVSVTDVMLATLSHLEHSGTTSPTDFRRMLAHKLYYQNTKVTDCLSTFGDEPMLTISEESSSLLDVIRLLCDTSQRRVFILNKDKQIINIITQSSVVHALNTLPGVSESFLDSTLSTSGMLLLGRPIHSITTANDAMDAFAMIRDKNVSGVPVVDETDGRLVGLVTAKDIRILMSHSAVFGSLHAPITKFLAEVATSRAIDAVLPTITCTTLTTVRDALSLLAATKLHRLICVDDDYKPIGVLSIRDVLAACLPTEKK